jgi:hypothetical protein
MADAGGCGWSDQFISPVGKEIDRVGQWRWSGTHGWVWRHNMYMYLCTYIYISVMHVPLKVQNCSTVKVWWCSGFASRGDMNEWQPSSQRVDLASDNICMLCMNSHANGADQPSRLSSGYILNNRFDRLRKRLITGKEYCALLLRSESPDSDCSSTVFLSVFSPHPGESNGWSIVAGWSCPCEIASVSIPAHEYHWWSYLIIISCWPFNSQHY